MSPVLFTPGLVLCLLSLPGLTLSLSATEPNAGNVQVSAKVWTLDSAVPLKEMGPLASQLPANPPVSGVLPEPQPMLPGMMPAPVFLPAAEAMRILQELEKKSGARSHPPVIKTVAIGEEVVFTLPFATGKLEMHVQTVLNCRLRDVVSLLASFPEASRSVNPVMEMQYSSPSYEDTSCLLCRTEAKGALLHHTLILLEESHYGVSGTDSVTRTRNQMQRLILPQAHLENLTPLRLLEWLVQQSREQSGTSDRTSWRGINAVWRLETAEDVKNSGPLGIGSLFDEKGMTLRRALTSLTELGQMDMGIEPHALVFHTGSTDNECSPGELYTRQFQVKPQILKRYVDSQAINQAARSSNIPIYYEDGGFRLDREHFILNYRQAPEHFMLAEKWLRDQNLLNEKPPPPPPLPAALARAGKIILPQLDLRRASLSEAVKAIQQAASAADPPVKNLNIVIAPGTVEKTFITMFTRGMPADEALKACARLSFHRIEADETTIILKPSF